MPLTVLHSPEEWTARFGARTRTVLSVGNFDGLHLGHQKILRMVLARARATGHTAAAITFDPHPMKLLRPDNAPRMIETLSQRLAGLNQLGLDAALVLRFDRALSLLSPEDFLQRILIERLHVAAILVGANFRFGHCGAGDVRLLARFGTRLPRGAWTRLFLCSAIHFRLRERFAPERAAGERSCFRRSIWFPSRN